MKKLFLFLFLFICLSNTLHAQDFPDMRSWSLYGDSIERYIFADTAFVRITPDTKQAPIDTLLAGDNITIVNITHNALTIRGLKGPWLQVSYQKNGESKTGYIWQGLVSCAPMRRGEIKFVYGIERRADSVSASKDTIHRYLVRLKVIQNGSILAKAAFVTDDDESANFSMGKVMSGMGLTNVQYIIVLTFSGEACAIPTYDYYFALTKDNQLIRLPEKTNIGDAGVFYHAESFTFPNEKNGKPDMVIWDMIEEETTEKVDKDGNEILKVTGKKTVNYAWDAVNGKFTVAK
ncbi:SH3 domain-containing protein [Chitinophaga niabensis]|uniref:SH3 domain-containing protein n=1 Tax=Chitinophaga niabensis TaxID=536979 RepID=UPI0031BA02B6